MAPPSAPPNPCCSVCVSVCFLLRAHTCARMLFCFGRASRGRQVAGGAGDQRELSLPLATFSLARGQPQQGQSLQLRSSLSRLRGGHPGGARGSGGAWAGPPRGPCFPSCSLGYESHDAFPVIRKRLRDVLYLYEKCHKFVSC